MGFSAGWWPVCRLYPGVELQRKKSWTGALIQRHLSIISGFGLENIGELVTKIAQADQQQGHGSGFVKVSDQRYIVRNQLKDPSGRVEQVEERKHSQQDCTQIFHSFSLLCGFGGSLPFQRPLSAMGSTSSSRS